MNGSLTRGISPKVSMIIFLTVVVTLEKFGL